MREICCTDQILSSRTDIRTGYSCDDIGAAAVEGERTVARRSFTSKKVRNNRPTD
jgi:hypothetical protein